MGTLQIDSAESMILLNPALPKKAADLIHCYKAELLKIANHLWLMTSGSTQEGLEIKLTGLSWDALKFSAHTVNKHFNVCESDRWLNPLPLFHVGGLGIWIRSLLSKSTYLEFTNKWSCGGFYQSLTDQKCTLTSLVPAQLFDLVAGQYHAPSDLRGVFVGGGALSDDLYRKALALNWPVIKTYGMTECCSQIAVTEVKQPDLKLLEHIALKVDEEQRIWIKSPSLLSYQAIIDHRGLRLEDPKVDGWYKTDDKGSYSDGKLQISGRLNDFVKIGGESVSLSKLEAIFNQAKLTHYFCDPTLLVALPDERLGHKIVLVSTTGGSSSLLQSVILDYHQHVCPYEKIRQHFSLESIPMSPLGKPLKNEIIKLLPQ